MFLGGQTVTLGSVISDRGNVSMVVDTGLMAQDLNDAKIKLAAQPNPIVTISIQNNLKYFLVDDM